MQIQHYLIKTAILWLVPFALGCGAASVKGEQSVDVAASDTSPQAIIDLAEDGRYVSKELFDLADLNDREVKTRLALALGRIGSPKAVLVLSTLATDDEEAVRENAYFSLGLIGGDGVEDILRKRLAVEKSVEMISVCMDALGRSGGDSMPELLMNYFGHEEARIRAAALRALGLYGVRGKSVSDEVVKEVAARLQDDVEQVRFMSAFALFRVAEPLPGPDTAVSALRVAAANDDSPDVRGYAIRALARRGGLNETSLVKALEDREDRVSAQVVSVLGLVAEEARCRLTKVATDHIAKRVSDDPGLLQGTYVHVVRAVLEATLKCPGESALKSKAAGIYKEADRFPADTRTAAVSRIRCLANLAAGYDDVSLVACDPDRPYIGKRMLAKRLGQGKETSIEAVELLSEMILDPDPRVVTAALESLGGIPSAKARQAVISAFDHRNPVVVSAVFDTLASHADNFVAHKGVVQAMGQTVERYRPFDHAQAPIVSAAFALAALNVPESVAILADLAVDPRPAVRGAVLAAYKSLKDVEPPSLLTPIRAARPVSTEEKSEWRGKTVEARVVTTQGTFTIEFYPELAPATVASFADLATNGFFDDSEIHRVVPNFVVQAGDPTGTGLGDPDYTLRCEVSPLPYVRGTVGMALAGKDTGGSQFFVALSPQPHLDGNYTVFGQVVSGMDVLDLIEEGDSILAVYVEVVSPESSPAVPEDSEG